MPWRQNKNTCGNNTPGATKFLPLPQYGGIMMGSDIMHATDFFLCAAFQQQVINIIRGFLHSPVPNIPPLDHLCRDKETERIVLEEPSWTHWLGAAHTVQQSWYSRAGDREITAYICLHFGRLPPYDAYKGCAGCCQQLQKLYWTEKLGSCQDVSHQAPLLQNDMF